MSGDPTNVGNWPDADAYVSFDLDEAAPADVTEDFAGGWEPLGLLSGEDGFTFTRDEDKTDQFAWGGILTRTTRKNFKHTGKLTALERNDTTWELVWPGSSTDALVVPRPARVKLALEVREDTVIERYITALYAEIEIDGDVTLNEGEQVKYPLLATIFPTGDSPGVLWVPQRGDTAGS